MLKLNQSTRTQDPLAIIADDAGVFTIQGGGKSFKAASTTREILLSVVETTVRGSVSSGESDYNVTKVGDADEATRQISDPATRTTRS